MKAAPENNDELIADRDAKLVVLEETYRAYFKEGGITALLMPTLCTEPESVEGWNDIVDGKAKGPPGGMPSMLGAG